MTLTSGMSRSVEEENGKKSWKLKKREIGNQKKMKKNKKEVKKGNEWHTR